MSKKNNLAPKIFAVIIAIFLWNFVMNDVNPDQTKLIRNVKVKLVNSAALDRQGLVAMQPEDIFINVEVEMKKSNLSDFSADKNITAQVDLSGHSEGEVRVPITVSLSNLGFNAKVVSWEPKEALFVFDRIIPRDKTVSIETTGEVPDGYILDKIDTKSQTISITGPRTWVNEVTKAVATIDLTNLNKSTTIPSVPVRIIDDDGEDVRGVDKTPGTIDIDIEILRTVSLPIELQTENELPDNFSIRDIKIHPSEVAIKGSNDIANLSTINTKVIDINSLLDKSSVQVELDLPEGVELLNPDQKIIISYTIEEIETKDYILNLGEIDIINLGENLAINDIDYEKEIRISLSGIKSKLENITNEDIKIQVDLIDLIEGQHEIELSIEEIEGINVEGIDPQPFIINLNSV